MRRARAGFTLLEVLVAVAILGLALTAIFSSEVGALRVGNRARRTNVATLLARCKMAEIEEQVANEGLPAIDDSGYDECCEDAEVPGYRCEWSIDRIVLPEMGLSGFSEENPAGDGEDDDGEDPQATAESLISGGGDMDGLTQMAMELAYPSLKPTLEDAVRRAKVRVIWYEGSREQSFDVVQYLVGEVGEAQAQPGEEGGGTGSGTGGGSGAP